MKKFLDDPVIKLNKSAYLSFIVILAPLLNFLAGINVDIYSPSMPSIADYFNSSVMAIKNTISITLLGWTFGALLFGILIDSIGRKKVLVPTLLIYIIACAWTPWCHTIDQLMLARFIQGFAISSITVGCRALVIDNITGPRYQIAILYLSIGYGSGPIIGPFIGGILQHTFGWQANFVALTVIAAFLTLFLFLFVKESIPQKQPLIITHIFSRSLSVIAHKKFMAGVIISGLIQIQLMLYPTLGPFIVENVLHKTAITYGNTALVVGAFYLIGATINRMLLRYIQPKKVCYVGYLILVVALLVAFIFTVFCELSLLSIMLPIILMCISAGLVFSNIMGANLKQFPESAGVSMAIQASILLLIASLGIFIISHVNITNLFQLLWIYLILILLEIFIFFFVYKNIFD